MKRLRLLAVLILSTVNSFGQNTPPGDIQPLVVGDSVPDIVFSSMINYPSGTTRISDFRGKLLILDFWATWCSSCLHHFPLLDSLQKKFNSRLQVLLINTKSTNDSQEKVAAFFLKDKPGSHEKYRLPSATDDTLADRFFAHRLIPHYVWINAQGWVIAITSSDPVNVTNIEDVLAGKPVQWLMKRDQHLGSPLFSNEDLPLDSLVHYSILLKGYFDGLPSGTRMRINGGIKHGIAITNTDLLRMYEMAAVHLMHDFNRKRLILNISDSSALIPDTAAEAQTQWYKAHAYNYELIVPLQNADSLYQYVLNDLNLYSGYIGKIEKRQVKCLVLSRNGQPIKASKGSPPQNNFTSSGVKYMQHQSVSFLVDYLDGLSPLPVIDETGYTEPLDLKLPEGANNIPALQKALAGYGFTLEETERWLEVFVVLSKSLPHQK